MIPNDKPILKASQVAKYINLSADRLRTYDICKIFGKKLFQIRKERGLSQEQLALDLDLDKSTIGKYEKAKRCINLRTAKKLADALGVKLSEMLD